MKIIRVLFICSIFVLLHTNMSFALENSNNSAKLNENTIKNFTYLMEYSGDTITLKNGEYESPLKPGNKKDILNYFHVKVEKYVIGKSSIRNQPVAIVILSENSGGSGTFFQITALIKEKDKITQTNSIMLGDRVVIKDLSFKKGYHTNFMNSKRDTIFLSMLTHKPTDPNCCPSQVENKCFNLVYDVELNKIKLVTCEEAEEKYSLPIVKKPAIYLYPEKTQNIEVFLKPKGSLTRTIPEYHNKWIVTANPDGVINGKYPYLFYEVNLSEQIKLPEQGWIVAKDDMEKWFDEYLPKLGLNNKEIRDFKEYWLAQLKEYPYYKIKILNGDFVNENLKIQIKPKPKTIIRVILYFEGSYNDLEKINNPVIKTPIRKGFTVVEWGGILKDSDKKLLDSEIDNILTLRELKIEGNKIYIRVDSGGCTSKETITVDITESKKEPSKTTQYQITFKRKFPDYCKAFLPDGVVLEYDLYKDFKIKGDYDLKITNPVISFDEFIKEKKVKKE